MPAMKWWLCCFGIHHISRRHGFNSFFLTPAVRSPRKSIDHFKPHQLFRQHLHGPPNAAFRWNRTGHLNQMRFLLPIQLLRHRRQRPRPTLQSHHRTLLHRPPTHVLAGPLRHPQRIHHLPVRQGRASDPLIHSQQNPCTPCTLQLRRRHRTTRARFQHRFQLIPLILELTPPCIALASNPPDPRTPSTPLL